MLLNGRCKNNSGPIPAYGTTRYSGAINFKEDINNQSINSPRNACIGSPVPCSKVDKWPMKSRNKRRTAKEDGVRKSSTESDTLTVCKNVSDESVRCTCDEIQPNEDLCTCPRDEESSSEISATCTRWNEILKLTDNSETKLVNSCVRLIEKVECISNDGNVNAFLDLFEPEPRETLRISGKNSAPPGYKMTLILPQCVCLRDYPDRKKIKNTESNETVDDEKSETISDLICMPSIAELSWDVMQTGMIEKIPEKYTTYLFENEKDESACTNSVCCKTDKKNVCKETNSGTTNCLHKAFLEKINQSFFNI